MTNRRAKVWDPAVRLLHWGFAGAVLLAWLVGDWFLGIHVLAGYTALALVGFRLVWGFVGTRHARFSDFVRTPREVGSYLVAAVTFRARRYRGHNPAGGAMVVALLIAVTLTGLTGLATYGAQEFAGPLAGLGTAVGPWVGGLFEELHEWFVNLTLLLVVLHLAGVAVASIQHRENLVRAMVTGYKPIHSEDE